MSWIKVSLSDVADFSNGVNFDKSAYSAGVKLIGVSNFGDRFSPDYDELQEIDAKVVRPGDYLRDGDIVFVRSNGNKELVGRCMLIKEPRYPVTYSGFCIRARIKDLNKHDSIFFTYYFKSKAFRKALAGNAIGANIQNLSQGRLSNHIACVPEIEIQRKIAGILSAYDDLIENNQKQIKLLEEAAQRLYKEWFVDLRFPGYETTPITDCIPEGWGMEELRNIATLKAGGDKPKVFSKEKSSNCNVPVFSNGTENEGLYGYTNQAEILDPCVTISARGSVGYTCLRKTAFVPIVRLISVIPTRIEVEYLYYFLKNMVFESNGAAQQQITVPMIKNKQVLLPSKTVMGLFVSQVRPMMDLRECLKGKIMSLCEARDRLLPKLMNGEIEV